MYDVLVIGGGHAGVEAATAAARRGARVAILTLRPDDVGQMSCNPSIGGVGKGHLVREVDAFGGVMGDAADRSAIHRRMLNRSKGSAVWGPRIQADRRLFAAAVRRIVRDSGVDVIAGEAGALLLQGTRVVGVEMRGGERLSAGAVVIATGTFLDATLFRGGERWKGGRLGNGAAVPLAAQLRELGLAQGRLKTGTPPRLDGRTIDWARLERQPSDAAPWSMSFFSAPSGIPQVDCFITRTTEQTHDVIRANLGDSPLYSGAIEGRGPRYCPSIEDKIRRFADRPSHQIFLEPEGLDDRTVYPNGISTSLGTVGQQAFLATVPGLERVRMLQPGYAVEYEFMEPRNLSPSLAHRDIANLFLAGQINGTTGYEEAAAQGMVAGMNAAAVAVGCPPVVFDRTTSYIGVMVDDLTLHGVTEPYRMMTARAEYRLALRADNAITRLGPTAIESGVLCSKRRKAVEDHLAECDVLRRRMEETIAGQQLGVPTTESRRLAEWARVEAANSAVRAKLGPPSAALDEVMEDCIYAPYVYRQHREWEAARGNQVPIPPDWSFDRIPGLSHEMAERLRAARPANLDQLGRVAGISPAAVSAVHLALMRASS